MFKVVTIKTFKNQKLIFVQVKRLQNSFCTKIAKRFPVYKPGTALAGVVGFEPTECWNQNPVPYHLAIPLYVRVQKEPSFRPIILNYVLPSKQIFKY